MKICHKCGFATENKQGVDVCDNCGYSSDEKIDEKLQDLANAYNNIKEDNMKNKYIDIAVEESRNTPERLEDNIEEYINICEKNLNTYIAKNIDYGDSFQILYDKFGLKSSIIRLHDKLLRLEQLAENDAEVDESIDDTLEDMINYAIMTLIARRQ